MIQGADRITVYDANHTQHTNIAIETIDGACDLALLRVLDASQTEALRIALTVPVRLEAVVVAGHPRGWSTQTLKGAVTSDGIEDAKLLLDDKGNPIFETSFPVFILQMNINSGMSGAPVVNSSGYLIGVIQGSLTEGGSLAWAISSKRVAALLDEHRQERSAAEIKEWPDLLGSSRLLRVNRKTYVRSAVAAERLGKILSDFKQLPETSRRITISSGTFAAVFPSALTEIDSSISTGETTNTPPESFKYFGARIVLSNNRAGLRQLVEDLERREKMRKQIWAFAAEVAPLIENCSTPKEFSNQKEKDSTFLRTMVARFTADSPEGLVGVDRRDLECNIETILENTDCKFATFEQARAYAKVLEYAISNMGRIGAVEQDAINAVTEEEAAMVESLKIFLKYEEFIEFRSN